MFCVSAVNQSLFHAAAAGLLLSPSYPVSQLAQASRDSKDVTKKKRLNSGDKAASSQLAQIPVLTLQLEITDVILLYISSGVFSHPHQLYFILPHQLKSGQISAFSSVNQRGRLLQRKDV